MSVWEFHACVDGYNRAHGGKEQARGEGMSADRARELGIEGF